MAGSLSWILEKSGKIVTVSRVSPNAPVRVCLPSSVKASAEIPVFLVAEFAIARLLAKWILRQPGRHETTLLIDRTKKFGVERLSTKWLAAEVKVGPKVAQFVARTDGFPESSPLRVAPKMAWDFTNPTLAARTKASLDSPLPVHGLPPLPIGVEVDVKNGRRNITGESFAPTDPAFEVRVMTASTTRPNFRAYLDDYLPAVAREHGVKDVQAFVDEFNQEYKQYLDNSAGLNVEAHPSTLNLGAGESKEVDVNLYPNQAGKAMIAVAAVDLETEELISVSDLIGLNVGTDEVIHRIF